MPLYDYRCASGHVISYRRPFADRELEAFCECGLAAVPVFSPNLNIHIPISFRQVLTGGDLGGGGLSWSDFHDVSERELAHQPNVEPYARAMSQPRVQPPKGIAMGEAYKEAKERLHG
jgi:hypothetical protein